MTVLNDFLKDMEGKYTAYHAQEHFDDLYIDIKIIKILGAKKGAYVLTYTNHNGKLFVEFWRSKRMSNPKRFYYLSEQSRLESINKWITNQREREAIIKGSRTSDKGRGLEVGDMLSSVWGYDQTNYNYYEVTKLIGDTMVEIREVNQLSEATGNMQGNCAPIAGDYTGETMRRRATDGRVKVCSVQTASIMQYNMVAGTRIYNAGHYTSYH